MKNEQITKRLSGDELDALLRAELENSDPAAALALLEELERREPEDAAATEAAWNTFNKHYLPMEGDTSLYEAESHRRPKVIPLIRRFSAAAVAAMLERKHGCFHGEAHHLHVVSGETDLDALCHQIVHWEETHGQ